MEFDLNTITEKGILIDTKISFGEEFLKLSQIKELNDVLVKGRIYYGTTKEVILDCTVEGSMKLVDYNTGELIDYPFNTKVEEVLASDSFFDEENSKNKQNNLDLKEILWQNIVLEVPIRASLTNEVLTKKGEGWELKDEFSKKDDPRLECFKALLDEGKE